MCISYCNCPVTHRYARACVIAFRVPLVQMKYTLGTLHFDVHVSDTYLPTVLFLQRK